MSYDPTASREASLRLYLRMVAAGQGWQEYAKTQVRLLAKNDPGLYGDLPRTIDDAIAAAKRENGK